jgi:uncharacterized protein YjbI with pentapeptide repeats
MLKSYPSSMMGYSRIPLSSWIETFLGNPGLNFPQNTSSPIDSEFDPVEVDFSGKDFRDADFSYARLKNISFRGANLQAANFTCADIKGVDFSGANLEKAVFKADKTCPKHSTINAAFRGVRLNGATIGNCDPSDPKFTLIIKGPVWGSDFGGATFLCVEINNKSKEINNKSKTTDQKYSSNNFAGATLDELRLAGNFKGSDFSNTTIKSSLNNYGLYLDSLDQIDKSDLGGSNCIDKEPKCIYVTKPEHQPVQINMRGANLNINQINVNKENRLFCIPPFVNKEEKPKNSKEEVKSKNSLKVNGKSYDCTDIIWKPKGL